MIIFPLTHHTQYSLRSLIPHPHSPNPTSTTTTMNYNSSLPASKTGTGSGAAVSSSTTILLATVSPGEAGDGSASASASASAPYTTGDAAGFAPPEADLVEKLTLGVGILIPVGFALPLPLLPAFPALFEVFGFALDDDDDEE